VTELVGAEQIIADSALARRRGGLAPEDRPTAIQIYGADPALLLEAARIAERAEPAFIDLNCGCWIPAIAKRGAGAGWLREPAAMVAMARTIVSAVGLPVTVKTRIGLGPESHMPIVDLARRLEDAGVASLTIHCRTAAMGHRGDADWQWAARAQQVVGIPVIVNGDIRSAVDVVRALDETGCAGAMVGRAAIDNPWIFGQAAELLAGRPVTEPNSAERREVYRAIVEGSVHTRGEKAGVASAKRHLGVLGPLAPGLRPALSRALRLPETLDLLAA